MEGRILSPESLADSYAVAEAIASKDQNNLYLASRYFADPEKYRAFCAMYAVMRVIDDRIDAIPSRTRLSAEDRKAEHDVVYLWEQLVTACMADDVPRASALSAHTSVDVPRLLEAFADAARRFPVPAGLWQGFFAAMHRDIDSAQFSTYHEFLEYAEGATVAPTTIYLYLVASRSDGAGGPYLVPEGFDLLGCGRQLGCFAYLGHILRDLAVDLSTGEEGLLYLAVDDMERHGVDRSMLFSDLANRKASPQVRSLVADLVERARGLLQEGRSLLAPLDGKLTPDCAFILELILTIYQEVINRIVASSYDPFSGTHQLSSGDKKLIAFKLARQGGFFR